MKNLDDLFEEGLGNYTEAPPPAAWSAFEKKLGAIPLRGGRIAYRRLLLLAVVGLFVISIPAMKYLPVFNSGDNTESAEPVITNNAANNTTSSNPSLTEPLTDNTNNNGIEKQAVTKENDNNEPNQPEQHQPIAQQTTKDKYSTQHNRVVARNKNNNSQITNTENDQPEEKVTYQSNLSKPAPADEPSENSNNELAAKPKEEPALTKAAQKPAVNVTVKNTPKPPKSQFNKWEAGIKAGYERGFDNDAAKKIVVSPYLQYNISPNFSVMLQPSIKGGEIANRRIGNQSSFYRQNADSTVVQTGPSEPVMVGSEAELYITRYRYTQSKDSIVKTYSIGGYFMECEMPLLIKYNISKTFSVYAGANLSYSKQVSVKEETYTVHIPIVTKDTFVITRAGQTPTPYPANSVIKFNGNHYSDYSGPAYTGSNDAAFRAGYMVGFSYEFHKRLLFDALVQQSNVRSNVQAGYNVNTALSAPYIRFTLGYKLTK